MSDGITNSCWNALILLNQAIKTYDKPIEFCALIIGVHEAVSLNEWIAPPDDGYLIILVLNSESNVIQHTLNSKVACFQLEGLFQMRELQSNHLPKAVDQLITVYAPYCFTAIYARHWQRAFTISHFAQSLDGRIATTSGESKWIGSPENLVHAHRMRALCDGILIGSKTLKRDQPQLTVRHVPGYNPIRIILGDSIEEVDSLRQSSDDPILLIGTNRSTWEGPVQTMMLERKNGMISSSHILETLYQQKIHSIYIEGGSITTSHFLQEKAIDIVQLHISPMILGGGLNTFQLPQIQRMHASVRFQSHMYIPVEDGFMFIGTLK